MEYNFREIEKKWQKRWVENKTYQVTEDETKQKYYVLNMFPYPSGAGLHVGHPLGYIASDIYARYKRLQGFNVLNPMGYDAYGLPAEQYAIQTGQHPAITTVNNINRYREQLDKIGFSFDWNREIRTCDPEYYHWTQWAFQKMFNSYYCNDEKKARPIEELTEAFAKSGNEGLNAACSEELHFTADEWNAMSKKEQQEVLMNYRIAYLGETMVNWCPQLGTVLANDEVVDGVSERGGFPVVQKKMRQWCLRVSAYAQRLLDGLDTIDWTESLKETQKNWIGRSEGAEIQFKVKDSDLEFTIFTTRADTMFGVTFMVLAPESELVAQVTTLEQKADVDAYLERTKKRTERERISDRSVTGVFSGSYAVNPFTGEAVPIWISDYVLAGYGTGAIMAVPAHDSRDYAFAKHFNLPIVPLVEGCDVSEESFDAKEGIVCNSPKAGTEPYCDLNLNGLTVKEAIAATKKYVKEHNLGRVKVNFRLRDAIFSRQRYWGEPFPVYYKDGMPYMIDESCLPLELPEGILGEAPRGDGKRVVILAEAQSLGVEAANALLKSLEEPRPGVCFLLLAPQRERLLPTLVSRGWVVTLAWPEAGTPSTPELFQWEEALAEFMASGQGWLDKTSGKGAVDAALARRIVLSVQKAQAALHAGRDGGPLGRRLAILPEAGHLHVNDLLAQCQESLDYMVSPPLVLNWLATRLHIVYRHARLRGRKPTA